MVTDKVVEVFMNDTKKDLNELFDRIRKSETYQAVSRERDKTLLEKMDKLYDFFESHDAHEMAKYDTINKDIRKINKIVWMALGVVSIVSFLGVDKIRILLLGG